MLLTHYIALLQHVLSELADVFHRRVAATVAALNALEVIRAFNIRRGRPELAEIQLCTPWRGSKMSQRVPENLVILSAAASAWVALAHEESCYAFEVSLRVH